MSDDKEARKLRLVLAVSEAVNESGLRWPEYGHAIAAALTNILDNPISVCVRDGDRAIEFDAEGNYHGRVEQQPPTWHAG